VISPSFFEKLFQVRLKRKSTFCSQARPREWARLFAIRASNVQADL